MRQILGMYLEQAPDEIRFVRTACAKARLVDDRGGEALRFSVSQSKDLAVLVVSSSRNVGVDIEAIRPVLQVGKIADRVLGPAEKTAFLNSDVSGREELFLRYWTRKKAYLKALGLPSRMPMDRVEVDFRSDTPVQLRAGLEDESDVSPCTACEFTPQTGFCGAFAVQGSSLPTIRYGEWFNQAPAASGRPCSPR